MTIPDAAIQAGALALVKFDTEQPHDTRDLARAAIEAAMPAIREAIAQEIEARDHDFDSGGDCGFAAEIVRGGAA